MFDLIRKAQGLLSVGQFDHASGRVISLEMVVSDEDTYVAVFIGVKSVG